MAGIQDFIAQATSKLGVSQDAASAATGGLGGLIQKTVGAGEFGKLAGAIPGLGDLVAKSGGGGGLGGMLGGLASKAGGLLGGGGAAAGALAAVTGAGISADKAGGFLSMFVDFAKKNVTPDVLKSVLGKVPGLGNLLG